MDTNGNTDKGEGTDGGWTERKLVLGLLAGLPTEPCVCRGCNGVVVPAREIGKRMREMRMRARVSQKHVAQGLGFRTPYISELENGHREWRDELVLGYVAALQATPAPKFSARCKR